MWNRTAISLGDGVASLAPFLPSAFVLLLEAFKQDTDPQNSVQDIFGRNQKQAVHRGINSLRGAHRASTESPGREPAHRPLEVAPTRHRPGHPVPGRPGRVRHLIEVTAESIKNHAVGGEGRAQIINIPVSLLTHGDPCR
jgi:hypothetical protein